MLAIHAPGRQETLERVAESARPPASRPLLPTAATKAQATARGPPGRQQRHADNHPFQRAASSASICQLLPTPAPARPASDRSRTNKRLNDGRFQDIERAIGRPSDQRVVVIRKPEAGRGASTLARR